MITAKQRREIEKVSNELVERAHALDLWQRKLERKEARLEEKIKTYNVRERQIIALEQQLEESQNDEHEVVKMTRTGCKGIIKALTKKEYKSAAKIALRILEGLDNAGY